MTFPGISLKINLTEYSACGRNRGRIPGGEEKGETCPMKQEIKLVAVDMDGTFVRSERSARLYTDRASVALPSAATVVVG